MNKNDLFQLLQEVGYQQLSPSWVARFRGGDVSSPLLDNVLLQQLVQINRCSTSSIDNAYSALKYANPNDYKSINTLLRNGKLLARTAEHDSKIFPVQYIDWYNTSNNTFQVVRELEVTLGGRIVKVDLALFVNGIPLVLLEFKQTDSTTSRLDAWSLYHHPYAVSTPFTFAHLLISVSPEQVLYRTAAPGNTQWYAWGSGNGPDNVSSIESILQEICRPDKLLQFVRFFILFNEHGTLIPRMHQLRAVAHTMNWIMKPRQTQSFKNGVVVQAIGTGVSVTITMLINRLLKGPEFTRSVILVVTNSNSEEEHIRELLLSFSLPVIPVASVSELRRLLKEESEVIVLATLHKFYGLSLWDFSSRDNESLFILIDERRKGSYETAMHRMGLLFPTAVCIGFTSTSLRGESQDVIYQYDYLASVNDHVNVAFSYQWRRTQIHASEVREEIAVYNKPWKRSQLSKGPFATDAVIAEIGNDITFHYLAVNKNTSFKGILIAPSKVAAIKYQLYFDAKKGSDHYISTAVLMLGMREAMLYEGEYQYRKYYDSILSVYGSEGVYIQEVIRKIQSASDEIEMLIATPDQLIGLDNPLFRTLYITRYLKGTQLLQAVASISRPAWDKQNAEIVDYVGVENELKESLRILTFAPAGNPGSRASMHPLDDSLLVEENIYEREVSFLNADDELSYAYLGLLQALSKEKRAKISYKSLSSRSLEAADKITGLLTRDWQLSSKVLEEISNYFEDMLFDLNIQYDLGLDLKEIDNLLKYFIASTRRIKS